LAIHSAAGIRKLRIEDEGCRAERRERLVSRSSVVPTRPFIAMTAGVVGGQIALAASEEALCRGRTFASQIEKVKFKGSAQHRLASRAYGTISPITGAMSMQDQILDFWFCAAAARNMQDPELWFARIAAVDQSIAARFGGGLETAHRRRFRRIGLPHAARSPRLLLDQFTATSTAKTPRAFAGDTLALGISIDRGRKRRTISR